MQCGFSSLCSTTLLPLCTHCAEQERQKLQEAMQKTKEDAEKRRQAMLAKIREEAEELEKSRMKAEEQRTQAQQVRSAARHPLLHVYSFAI